MPAQSEDRDTISITFPHSARVSDDLLLQSSSHKHTSPLPEGNWI